MDGWWIIIFACPIIHIALNLKTLKLERYDKATKVETFFHLF